MEVTNSSVTRSIWLPQFPPLSGHALTFLENFPAYAPSPSLQWDDYFHLLSTAGLLCPVSDVLPSV